MSKIQRRFTLNTMTLPVAEPQAARFVDDYLLYLMARASHLISSEFHEQLRRRGVSVPVWRVLACLVGSGGETVTGLGSRGDRTVGLEDRAAAGSIRVQRRRLPTPRRRAGAEGLTRVPRSWGVGVVAVDGCSRRPEPWAIAGEGDFSALTRGRG